MNRWRGLSSLRGERRSFPAGAAENGLDAWRERADPVRGEFLEYGSSPRQDCWLSGHGIFSTVHRQARGHGGFVVLSTHKALALGLGAGSSCGSIGGVIPKTRLESELRHNATTVTGFLERLVGEPIEVHEHHHVTTQAAIPNLLAVEEGHRLLKRSSVLRGRRSEQPYLHATSLIVPSRLPSSFCRQLEMSSDPIGRIFEREAIAFTRSPLPGPPLDQHSLPGGSSQSDDCLFTRSYRVEVEGVPIMVITEWFLTALARFLGPV